MNIKRIGLIGTTLAALLFSAGTVRAQDAGTPPAAKKPVTTPAAPDPVSAAPQAFKERLNNDKVRVMEYASKPGDKEAMHAHGRTALHVISGGKTRHTFPDGKTKEVEYKDGEVLWREPVTHSVENIGTTELRIILTELK